MVDFNDYLRKTVSITRSLQVMSGEIDEIVDRCVAAIRSEKKIIFCGNGGSAGDSQHFAAEFMGRFLLDRNPMPALSLTVDTSALTAIGNDYGFEQIFARQLRGVGVKGDVLFGLSTSGNSKNVVRAFEVAREIGISTIGFTGCASSEMSRLSDVLIQVSSDETNFIQEAHFVVGHYICLRVENILFS